MSNFLTSCRHEDIFDVMTSFDVMTNFLTSLRDELFDVVTCIRLYDEVFYVIINLLTSWLTFSRRRFCWRHDVFLTSWWTFWYRDVLLTQWRTLWRIFDVMTNFYFMTNFVMSCTYCWVKWKPLTLYQIRQGCIYLFIWDQVHSKLQLDHIYRSYTVRLGWNAQ